MPAAQTLLLFTREIDTNSTFSMYVHIIYNEIEEKIFIELISVYFL